MVTERLPSQFGSSNSLFGQLTGDFQLLGLPTREARVDVIRNAAALTAAKIHSGDIARETDVELMLSSVATSTYRLLDPRNRARSNERVQLAIPVEADVDRTRSTSIAFPPLANASTRSEQLLAAKREIVDRLRKSEKSDHRRVGAIALSLAAILAGCAAVLTWSM